MLRSLRKTATQFSPVQKNPILFTVHCILYNLQELIKYKKHMLLWTELANKRQNCFRKFNEEINIKIVSNLWWLEKLQNWNFNNIAKCRKNQFSCWVKPIILSLMSWLEFSNSIWQFWRQFARKVQFRKDEVSSTRGKCFRFPLALVWKIQNFWNFRNQLSLDSKKICPISNVSVFRRFYISTRIVLWTTTFKERKAFGFKLNFWFFSIFRFSTNCVSFKLLLVAGK